MKVLHVINTAYTGGAEVHLLGLVRELVRRDVDVSVAFLRTGLFDGRSVLGDFEALGVRVYALGANSRYGLSFVAALWRVIRREQPDVLHTHLPRADIAGMLAAVGGPRWMARVVSLHNIYGQYWAGRAILPLCRVAWRMADGVIAISRAVREWLIGPMGTPSRRVRVIHYGLDLGEVDRRRAGRRPRAGAIGSVARLERRKNHECLVRAMPYVLRRHPQARLCIAGHEAVGYREILQRSIDELGMGEVVTLTGFEGNVVGFLEGIEVFAFASRAEGFGLVVLEAMAVGRPVVASAIAPVDEIVLPGRTGFLADPEDPVSFADAIDVLLRDTSLARRLGEAGRRRVEEEFSLTRMVDSTLDVYRDVVHR